MGIRQQRRIIPVRLETNWLPQLSAMREFPDCSAEEPSYSLEDSEIEETELRIWEDQGILLLFTGWSTRKEKEQHRKKILEILKVPTWVSSRYHCQCLNVRKLPKTRGGKPPKGLERTAPSDHTGPRNNTCLCQLE